jgi:acetyl-CoA synthetase
MQPAAIGNVIWEPSPLVVARSHLQQFLDRHRIPTLAELNARAAGDLPWFWNAVVRDLGIHFHVAYQAVMDVSEGPQWARWWCGGKMNIAASCLDIHLDAPDRLAVIWEGEPGGVRRLTYQELNYEVARFAAALEALGVEAGDRVGVFMPMLPETVIGLLACAHLGAVSVPIFSGFGAPAIASRLNDAKASLLLCADGFYRHQHQVRMKEVADAALAACVTVRHVVMVSRLGIAVPWQSGRDHRWEDLRAYAASGTSRPWLDPESPLMILYTSGTTGRPKGALHVHGGFPIKAAQDLAHGFDLGPDDRLFWATDIGWMMGPWLIFGGLIRGATLVLYEGALNVPGPDRLWKLAAQHGVTVLGVSPSLIRGLMGAGDNLAVAHDLSQLRVLGGTGEPWNPEAFLWFFQQGGGGRLPVINYSGGTEISGGILGGNLLTPLRPCSFAGPLPGMDAVVVDESGRSVREQVGELAIRQPWPGMARGFWQDRERYLETYWARHPGLWLHGDWAYIAADGLWYVLGRSDDTIKVAGKRLGPAEVEGVLNGQAAVLESAAVGLPDPVKGEAVHCFVVLRAGFAASPELAAALLDKVSGALGRPLRPEAVHFVPDLPRTRNAKILRRVVRAVYLGEDPGDLSALENPASLEAIESVR